MQQKTEKFEAHPIKRWLKQSDGNVRKSLAMYNIIMIGIIVKKKELLVKILNNIEHQIENEIDLKKKKKDSHHSNRLEGHGNYQVWDTAF